MHLPWIVRGKHSNDERYVRRLVSQLICDNSLRAGVRGGGFNVPITAWGAISGVNTRATLYL